MNIKKIIVAKKDHLTQTQKTYIKLMFKQGLMEAKIKNSNYCIRKTEIENEYTVTRVFKQASEWISQPAKTVITKTKFSIQF